MANLVEEDEKTIAETLDGKSEVDLSRMLMETSISFLRAGQAVVGGSYAQAAATFALAAQGKRIADALTVVEVKGQVDIGEIDKRLQEEMLEAMAPVSDEKTVLGTTPVTELQKEIIKTGGSLLRDTTPTMDQVFQRGYRR